MSDTFRRVLAVQVEVSFNIHSQHVTGLIADSVPVRVGAILVRVASSIIFFRQEDAVEH